MTFTDGICKVGVEMEDSKSEKKIKLNFHIPILCGLLILETVLITNSVKYANVLPWAGFITFFTAAIHKIVRTGTYMPWSYFRHGLDNTEIIMILYGFPIAFFPFFVDLLRSTAS